MQIYQGLGDTGLGWKPVADMFSRDKSLQHIKWVLPHAYVHPGRIILNFNSADRTLDLTKTLLDQ